MNYNEIRDFKLADKIKPRVLWEKELYDPSGKKGEIIKEPVGFIPDFAVELNPDIKLIPEVMVKANPDIIPRPRRKPRKDSSAEGSEAEAEASDAPHMAGPVPARSAR